MDFDPVLLARIQFWLTAAFHFIYPSISIGLAWILVILERKAWKTGDEGYERAARFFGKLFAITFAMGVATGITMEFQFGTNWAKYAEFVGDIFGAPLAAEALLSFFLESTFLGLYLFGRGKVSKGAHWFSILMVAFGATLSGLWIIAANSWQHTPTGYVLRNGRAELVDFFAALFNPSMPIRFLHVIDASIITGSFFVAGISAWLLLKDPENAAARKAIRVALIVALIASLLELFPIGHKHALDVWHHNPAKLATFEGHYEGSDNAGFVVFGIPREDRLDYAIKVPYMLSIMLGHSPKQFVQGRNDFPKEDLPPVVVPFVSFHLMAGLGMFFIGASALGVFLLVKNKLWSSRWFLYILGFSIPLPVLACQLGWIATEVGRQPWIVYKLLRTADAASVAVTAPELLISLFLFTVVYGFLGMLYVLLLIREVQRGPQPVAK